MRFRTFTLLTTALLLAATPVQAQSKKDLAAQDAAMATRLLRLEQRMLTGDPAAERLMARIDALEASQRTLRGEVERLAFERDGLQTELQALRGDLQAIVDLSNRMKIHLDAVDLVAKEQRRPVPSGPIYSGPSSTISSVPSAPTFGERQIEIAPQTSASAPAAPFETNDIAKLGDVGKQKLAEGDFLGAQTALKQYLEFNPTAADAGEMRYWLGEAYFVRGGYADAADSYITSMRKDPQGVKAPDAMVRLAASLRQLGKTTEACAALASFPQQYPNASDDVKSKASVEAARAGC